ncbi:MAG: type 1 fimbrial protein [Stenotrophomonas sp.]|nr:type 1 fimbrial protein [Stenotrophomonas sp.]
MPTPLALILLGAAGAAQAQSGDITINGAVSTVTCEVSFDGVVGNDAIVTLPTVAASSLLSGQSGGRTPVVVRISGADPVCSSDRLAMALNTDRSANLLNGRLRNSAIGIGGGTNAVVALRDAQDAPMDLTGGTVLRPVAADGGVAEFTFSAEYYADSQDTVPGSFQAPLRYTLNYP